jgi:hypothetical protein
MTEKTAAPGAAEPGAEERLMDAPITSVTVFRDGARVLRAGLIEATRSRSRTTATGTPR